MGLLLLIAALVLLFVPGLFVHQVVVGVIILGVIGLVFALQLIVGALGVAAFKRAERRFDRF